MTSNLAGSNNNQMHHSDAPLSVALLGPWGSGKTTTLNSIVEHCGIAPDRVGIIIAEFGDVNVDGGRIAKGRKIEVPNRCICCHGAESLLEGIRSLAPHVDLILVEASGVSNGEDVRRVLATSGLSHTMLGLVNVGGFSLEDDRDLYDSQLPSVDRVVLTHLPEVVNQGEIDASFLQPVREYLMELDCLHRLVVPEEGSVGQQVWREILYSAPTDRSTVEAPTATVRNKHHQTVISLVLYPTVSVAGLREMLDCKSEVIDRAKGVITDESGVRRDFDYVRRRNSRGVMAKTLTLSADASSSDLLDGRDHIVLFSRKRAGVLKHEDFISFGLPNITPSRIETAQKRYPRHRDFYERQGTFPSYSHEGDRFYGILYPIITSLERVPTDMHYPVLSLWRSMLQGYVNWRCEGLSEIDMLRKEGHVNAGLTEAENLIAANLLWHAVHMSEHLDVDTRKRLATMTPAWRYFASMSQLNLPPESGGTREFTGEYQQLISEFMTYARNHEGIEQELLSQAIEHAIEVDPTCSWVRAMQLLPHVGGAD